MEIINKKGEIISTEPVMVKHDEFIKIMKKFTEVRVGVGGGDKPFTHIFLKVSKKDVRDAVRMNQMDVTYSIMYNSLVNEELNANYHDILYIHKMRTTLLDEKRRKGTYAYSNND